MTENSLFESVHSSMLGLVSPSIFKGLHTPYLYVSWSIPYQSCSQRGDKIHPRSTLHIDTTSTRLYMGQRHQLTFSPRSLHPVTPWPLSLAEPLGHRLPVDDVPNSAEVLGLAVLVLQVVSVLPGVDA